MIVDNLIANLKNPQPAVRLDIVRVLGMVEETQALDPLRERYREETNPALKEALLWAGRRIYAARQNGFSTVEAIFQRFGVYHELERQEEESEAGLLKKLDDNLRLEMVRRQRDASQKKTNMAMAAGLAGTVLGGMGTTAMTSMLQAGAEVASSNLEARPVIGSSRAPAIKPTSAGISRWVMRLREGDDAPMRKTAAHELFTLNNPAALPHLAHAFLTDPAPEVREAAERAGKLLYWNTVYWEMEQDGSLAREIEQRKAASGSAAPSPSPPAPAPQEDVAEILRRAEEARRRRLERRGK